MKERGNGTGHKAIAGHSEYVSLCSWSAPMKGGQRRSASTPTGGQSGQEHHVPSQRFEVRVLGELGECISPRSTG